MKLTRLLSFVLLVPMILLTPDAKAAGHGPLYDLANSISQTIIPALAGGLGQQEIQQIQVNVNNKLGQFRDAYDAEPRVITKRQGLGALAARVGNLAARTSEAAPGDLKDIIKTLIAFLKTNFVDQGIKIDDAGSISLRDARDRCAPTLRPQLQALVAANNQLH
jgi:hypothetical protein